MNLAHGWSAATGAMGTEFLYRATTAGFYGAITQHLAGARPRWQANLVTLAGMPLVAHSIETAIHHLRQTPNLKGSTAVSVTSTQCARGVLGVGGDGQSVWSDLAAMPQMIASFVFAGPMAIARCARRN